MARGFHSKGYGMAKLINLVALFLVGYMLIASHNSAVAAEEEMLVVEAASIAAAEEVSTSGGSVNSSIFWGHWGYTPYFPWWPVDYCAWDYSTTGIWQITYTGVACDIPYGRRLANYARSTMTTSRSFRNIMMGVSPVTSTVMCAKGSKAGQIIYTVQVRAPNTPQGRQVMQRLRATSLPLARSMYTATSMRTIGLFKGKTCGRVCAPGWGLDGHAFDMQPLLAGIAYCVILAL
jgi:hypothetical protein